MHVSLKKWQRVYADRMGNGSEATNDGFKFRGRLYTINGSQTIL
jgi:predicted chitinase